MNDFGKSHLEKFGWKQGEGLGKDKKGIKRSITVTKKNDTNGIGATNTNFDFPWWDHIYNKVSSNVIVDKDEDDKIKVASKESDVLSQGVNRIGIISVENPTNRVDPDTIVTARVLNDSQKNIKKALYSFFAKGQYTSMDANDKYLTKLTDEELFEKCGRRTARRGARFDQSGKIKRTSEALSEDPSNASSEADSSDSTSKKAKKEKKEKKDKKDKKSKKEKKSKDLVLESNGDDSSTDVKAESQASSSEKDSDLAVKASSKKEKKDKKKEKKEKKEKKDKKDKKKTKE